eukprot:TCONS_00018632-protein
MATALVDHHHRTLISKINHRITSNEKFFSLEFYPPRTPSGTFNLFEKCDRFSKGQPLFCDVTCDKVKDERKSNHSVKVASTAQNITMCDTMVQLNAHDLVEEKAIEVLSNAKDHGLSTVMVLMEGIEESESSGDFECSAELVRFIREVYEDYFTICVAGYPNCIEYESFYEQSMEHLIEEVEAGADFIITQMVFDATDFFKFVNKCRENSISVPILPGIFPIQSYGCITQVARHSRIKIPNKIMNVLKPIKNNDASVLKYGIFLTVELCKYLLQNALCAGLHFYTLNRETATTEVLKRVGLWREAKLEHRVLPWKSDSDSNEREGEEVRPIFWSCRPKSYEHRTSCWENFPNGRWGDSSTAEFGSFKDYHLFFAKNNNFQEQKKMWGDQLTCLQDIFDVFVAFISGKPNKNGVKVKQIPWSEEDLAPETSLLTDELLHLNQNGILTINSQPNVNCVPSTDKTFGWGNPGGYVFQKGYLEFFCSEEDAKNLLTVLKNHDTINYHLVKASGDENYTNCDDEEANVVTWGVFTGSLVIQPTVVDPVAFHYWKEEAFELWIEQWGRLYGPSSKSRQMIQQIHDGFYLANLVDNDYPRGNRLFDVVRTVIGMRK